MAWWDGVVGFLGDVKKWANDNSGYVGLLGIVFATLIAYWQIRPSTDAPPPTTIHLPEPISTTQRPVMEPHTGQSNSAPVRTASTPNVVIIDQSKNQGGNNIYTGNGGVTKITQGQPVKKPTSQIENEK